MHSIVCVQLASLVAMVDQHVAEGPSPAIRLHDLDPIDKVRPQPPAPPENAGTGSGAAKNGLPFVFQPGEAIRRQPIHVVQQDKARDGDVMVIQKPLYRIAVHLDLVGQPRLQSLEVFGPKIFRATVRAVTTGDVDSPEVIVRDR